MTNIEWTDATWNPVVGCTRASAGCDNCYAVTMTHRLEAMGQTEKYGGLTVLNNCGDRHFNGVVRCVEDALPIPLRWRKPRRVFVNSMSDLFHRDVPFEFIDRVFAVMALCPQHTFQVLTKRPERMASYLRDRLHIEDDWRAVLSDVRRTAYPQFSSAAESEALFSLLRPCLPNVWLGTSCEDQKAADDRIPHLLRCPATVRFLSCEPLLGPIDLYNDRRDWIRPLRSMFSDRPPIQPGVDWVIVGGESGAKSRPCNVDWIRSIVRQCSAAAVPCFVKQVGSKPEVARCGDCDPCLAGEMCPYGPVVQIKLLDRKGGDPSEWPEDLRVRQMPNEERTTTA